MVTIMDHEEGTRREDIVEDPMSVPRSLMEEWTPQLLDELPEAFCGKRSRKKIWCLYRMDVINFL